jgi:hypothetical protein
LVIDLQFKKDTVSIDWSKYSCRPLDNYLHLNVNEKCI